MAIIVVVECDGIRTLWVDNGKLTLLMYWHTCTQPFYGPFSETTQVSQCQKKSSCGLYGARGAIRGRHTDNPAGRQSSWVPLHPD